MSIFNNLKKSLESIDGKESDSITRAIGNITSSLKSTPSIIAKEMLIEGDIVSSGVIEIEGTIKGTIKSNSVVIRESGIVEGNINAGSVTIHGKFDGTIEAENINLSNKARVTGNISYKSLSVEDGALVDGQFKQLPTKKSKES